MRTTISLVGHVAALLRKGFARLVKPTPPRKRFQTTVHDAGRCYLPNLDNPAEVLAIAEGEWYK